MKTVEVIQQLEKFDKEGRVSGVVDDRGEFVVVSFGILD
jgi:hypothetical protein